MGLNDDSIVVLEQNSPIQHDLVYETELNNHFKSMKENVAEKVDIIDQDDENPICRICHCSSEDVESNNHTEPSFSKIKHTLTLKNQTNFTSKLNVNDPFFLISPCFCTGTLKYVHHNCLQHWIRSSNHRYCELCKYNFKLKTKSKPLYKVCHYIYKYIVLLDFIPSIPLISPHIYIYLSINIVGKSQHVS